MMVRYSDEPYFTFQEGEQKLDQRCEINKHIVVFTYQLYRFVLGIYNDMHKFSNNRACVAK
jgi:hypothetical protein